MVLGVGYGVVVSEKKMEPGVRAFCMGAIFMMLALLFIVVAGTRNIDEEMPVFATSLASTLVFIVLAAEYCSHFAKETERSHQEL
jgi:hypothetical protein